MNISYLLQPMDWQYFTSEYFIITTFAILIVSAVSMILWDW